MRHLRGPFSRNGKMGPNGKGIRTFPNNAPRPSFRSAGGGQITELMQDSAAVEDDRVDTNGRCGDASIDFFIHNPHLQFRVCIWDA